MTMKEEVEELHRTTKVPKVFLYIMAFSWYPSMILYQKEKESRK